MQLETLSGDTARITTIDLTICIFAKYRLHLLEELYEEITRLFDARGLAYEILVIASSADRTDEERASKHHLSDFAEHHAAQGSHLKIFQIPVTMEKATALKMVESFIRGGVLLTVDTGGRLRPEDIEKLLKKVSEGYDLVNGVRDWRGEPVVNRVQSECFNWMTRKVTGTRLHDLNSTVKIFRRDVLENVPLYGDFFRFLPVLAERKGFRVTDVALTRREEQRKSTVYGVPSYIRRVLDLLNLIFLTRFTEKPLRFFGGVGMVSVLIGVAINAWLVYERFIGHEKMRDRPLLLLGILFIVMGVQVICTGLIGEIVIYSRTMDFKSREIEVVL